MMRFKEKSVLITGAAGGIGKACALAFAQEGAKLVLADIKESLEETADLCRELGTEVRTLQLDVSTDEAAHKLTQTAITAYGRLDVAMNNAGIVGQTLDIAEYDDEVWDQVMNINVRSIFRAMKSQITCMRKQGKGSIVNTASVASFKAMKMSAAYITAKHALLGLTRAAALDVVNDGIRINAVCPGMIDTPLLDYGKTIPGLIDSLEATIPMDRMGRADEIARCTLFLASDEASYITGQGMIIDGGVTLT